jgi:hypothetical protein
MGGPALDVDDRQLPELVNDPGEVLEVSPQTFRQALDRTRRPDYRRWSQQVDTTGGCSRPVTR